MEIPTAVILFILAGVVVAGYFVDDTPKLYRSRKCRGAAWRRRFPEASKQTIRAFLEFFAAAFAIRKRHVLKFGPDDGLLAIYRARYPSRGWPDALEFETLARDMRNTYQLSLEEIWHDRLTLGEVFMLVCAAQPGAQCNPPTRGS